MPDKVYTPEVMTQAARIYDKLECLPPDKRFLAAMMADAFINGMLAREHLIPERESA